jgi:sirohydrochlorin ferrochelatase
MALLSKVIGWLRAGYPDGVPDVDYIPLFALLGRHLTDTEVKDIADELARTGDAHCADAIHAAINERTHAQPNESDLGRVRARLAAGGWPLAWPGSEH